MLMIALGVIYQLNSMQSEPLNHVYSSSCVQKERKKKNYSIHFSLAKWNKKICKNEKSYGKQKRNETDYTQFRSLY